MGVYTGDAIPITLAKKMHFYRVPTFSSLPDSGPVLDHEDEAVIAESDLGYDRLAARLSDLYLVDSGDGPDTAPINMNRYVDPCRHHTIVVDEPAWHPSVAQAMIDVLSDLPDGWTFGIDATDFPPGQAHIMVTKAGDIYGWSEFGSRSTLERFGFEPVSNPIKFAFIYLRGGIESIRRSIRVRRLLNNKKANKAEMATPRKPSD